jgi:hypothetical protein
VQSMHALMHLKTGNPVFCSRKCWSSYLNSVKRFSQNNILSMNLQYSNLSMLWILGLWVLFHKQAYQRSFFSEISLNFFCWKAWTMHLVLFLHVLCLFKHVLKVSGQSTLFSNLYIDCGAVRYLVRPSTVFKLNDTVFPSAFVNTSPTFVINFTIVLFLQ